MSDAKMRTFLILYAVIVLLYLVFGNRLTEKFEEQSDTRDSNLDYLEELDRMNNQALEDAPLMENDTDYQEDDGTFYKGATRDVAEDKVKRECAIYYTKQWETCKDYERWYNLPSDALAARANDMKMTATQRNAATTIIDDLNKNKAGMPNRNVCRINLGTDGWVEPQVYSDGQNAIPRKNTTDTVVNDRYRDPLNWGECYKALAGRSVDDVIRSSGLGDNGIRKKSNDPQSPMYNDTTQYAEINFSSHKFDDYGNMRSTAGEQYASHIGESYCKMARAPPKDVPAVCFRCLITDNLQGTGKYVLRKMSMVKMNEATLQFDELPQDNSVLGMLYKKMWVASSRSLWLVPRNLATDVLIVYWDACGRADTVDTVSRVLNLTDIANIKSQRLALSASTVTDGDYDTVVKRRDALINEIAAKEALMREYANENAPDLKRGIILEVWNGLKDRDLPVVSNPQEMTNVIDRMLRVSSNNVTVVGQVAAPYTATQSKTSFNDTRTYAQFTGYLRIPTNGTYRFLINSDDAGDVRVGANMELVAKHYNYHATDARGTSVGSGIYYNAGDNVPFSVRVFNGDGPGGLNVYWSVNTGNNRPTFEYIPSSAYYYNSNKVRNLRVANEKAKLESDRDTVNKHLEKVDKETARIVESTLDVIKTSGRIVEDAANTNQTISALDKEIAQQTNANERKKLTDQKTQAVNRLNALRNDLKNTPPFLGSKFDAKFLSGINARTPLERYVFLNFTSVDGKYTDLPPAIMEDNGQVIVQSSFDLGTRTISKTAPAGITYNGDVSYTLTFAVYITKTLGDWRNLICLGVDDSDRTPSLYIVPDQTTLHVRHATPSNWNFGIDITNYSIPLNKWTAITLVVDKTQMSIYFMASDASTSTSQTIQAPANERFAWNPRATPKKMLFNTWNTGDKTYIKNVIWYNNAYSPSDIDELNRNVLR